MKNMEILEQLSYVKMVIPDSRRATNRFGAGYIIWGLAIGSASLLEYLQLKGIFVSEFYNSAALWATVILAAFVIHMLVYWFFAQKKRSVSFAERIVNQIWVSGIIAINILNLAAAKDQHLNAYACIAVIIAFAVYINGFVADLKFFQALGLVWAISALVMFQVGLETAMLIGGILYLGGFALPGVVLVVLEKKQNSRERI